MRQTEVTAFEDQYEDRNFYQVTYPEVYIFAHSRHTYVDIDELRDADYVPNAGGTVTMQITDNTTSRQYTEFRRLDEKGKATFDISRFLQIFMDGTLGEDTEFDYTEDSKLVTTHSVTVALKYGGVTFWTTDFEVVNGADEPTDNWWNGQRRLHWWCKYPFTFDYRNLNEASITINGGTTTVGNLPQDISDTNTFGRIRINPNSLIPDSPSVPVGYTVNTLKVHSMAGMGFVNGSFSGAKANTVILIGHQCSPNEKDIYLRWLNRHGEMSYWLFNRHSIQRKPKATDSQRAYVKDERFGATGVIDNSILRTLTLERELKCFTDALDGIDYEIVRQLFTSPVVDLFLPEYSTASVKRWQRVHIKAETQAEALRHADQYTYNRQVTITLTLPEEGQLFV